MVGQSPSTATADALGFDEQKLNLSTRRLAAQTVNAVIVPPSSRDVEVEFRNRVRVYRQRVRHASMKAAP